MRRALALLVACSLALAPAALADGDPASDVLIGEHVFYPYWMELPASSTERLEKTIAEARKDGFPIRVALIAHDFDLGSAGLLYKHPQEYAAFLAPELANFNRDWILVVMPNGYGIYRCVAKERPGGYSDPCEGTSSTPADQRLLASIPAQERGGKDFAAAAEQAVRRLAESHGAGFGSGPPWPLLGGAFVLCCAAVVIVVRSRRKPVAHPAASA